MRLLRGGFLLVLSVCVVCAAARADLLERARAALQKGDYASAEACYRRLLESDPRAAELWNNLGITLNRQERFTDAADAFRRALELKPTLDGARLNLGIAWFRATRWSEAAETLELLPNNTQARELLAHCYLAAGRPERAVPLLEALTPSSDDASLHVALGDAYSRTFQADRALAAYRRALQLAAALPGLRLQIGRLLWSERRFDEAEPELLAAGEVEAKYYLGAIWLYRDEPTRAAPLLDEFVRARPNAANGHFELGRARLAAGDLGAAISALEKAAALSPAEPQFHYQLGQAYRRAGRIAEAERALGESSRLRSTKRDQLVQKISGEK